MRNRSSLIAGVFISVALFSCGGGGGSSGNNPPPQGLTNCNQSGYNIYLGYYNEDPTNNPEDPTAGFLVACMPSSDGSFKSQFLFSYTGCQGGVDKGTVDGNRTCNNISGNWSGNVDGTNIGGSFDGNWDSARSRFSGTWNNSSGKVKIDFGSSCNYWVAGNGTWVLYGLDSDDGNLNIQVSGSSITWNNAITGVNGFLISFYDKQCMYDKISLSDCTTWSLSCPSSVSSLTYNSTPIGCMNLFGPNPLTSGKDYVVSITAFGNSQSDVKAFASKTFTAP